MYVGTRYTYWKFFRRTASDNDGDGDAAGEDEFDGADGVAMGGR